MNALLQPIRNYSTVRRPLDRFCLYSVARRGYPLPSWPHASQLAIEARLAPPLFGSPSSAAFRAQRTGPTPHCTATRPSPRFRLTPLRCFFQPPPTRTPTRPPRAHSTTPSPSHPPPSSSASHVVLGGGGRRGHRSPVLQQRSVHDRRAPPPRRVPPDSAPKPQVS